MVMSRERAILLSRALEIVARTGMMQFRDLLELLCPKIKWDESDQIEYYLKHKLTELNGAQNSAISNKNVPEQCQIAWDAYQHLRREIAWFDAGKDWRKDERVWSGPDSMMKVNFDEPMKISSTPGDFKTERVDDAKDSI